MGPKGPKGTRGPKGKSRPCFFRSHLSQAGWSLWLAVDFRRGLIRGHAHLSARPAVYQLQQASSPISSRPSSCLYQLQQASSPIFPSVQLSTRSSNHRLPSLPARPAVYQLHQTSSPISFRRPVDYQYRGLIPCLPSNLFAPAHRLSASAPLQFTYSLYVLLSLFALFIIYLFFRTFPLLSKRCNFGPKRAKSTVFLSFFRPKMPLSLFCSPLPKGLRR